MSEPRTVLIVEDEPATRARLAAVVRGMPELRLLAAVESCEQARAALESDPPDLLLTDLGLPDGSGADLIEALRARSPEAEAVVITMFGDEQNVIGSIERGATGYLLKGGSREDVERALRELLAGGSPVSPAIARHLLRRLRPAEEPAAAPEPEVEGVLSARETEVLSLVAKGFTFVEIAELLSISAHTVTAHMRRVYRKLEVRSRSEAVFEAASLGLIEVG